ncbi:hypothetical protein KAU45_02770, partial [bacterium]|nr:hypothetical protein [bacterium]
NAGMYNGLSLFTPIPKDRPVFAQRLWDLPPEPANSDFVVRGEAALFIDYEDGREELYTDYENHPVDVSLGNEELVAELKVLLADWHVRNRELMEYYGTTSPAEPEDRTQIEKLRALGYLQ